MTDLEPNETDDGRRQRQKALARWENEGGFSPPTEPDKIPALSCLYCCACLPPTKPMEA
ncbi:hypothetical protein SPH9361_03316 [Sphingobium sp. CECT 9361]|jgi:hypothetical protein|nr:hypothetical protein SPH9361_03316 [Sphingobium sp. CECT 9361]